jgi:hypothetical protein
MSLRPKLTLQENIQTDLKSQLQEGGAQDLRKVLELVEELSFENVPSSTERVDTKSLWTDEMSTRISNAVSVVLANYIDAFVREADIKGSSFSVVSGEVIVQVTGNATGTPNTSKAVKLEETNTIGDMN